MDSHRWRREYRGNGKTGSHGGTNPFPESPPAFKWRSNEIQFKLEGGANQSKTIQALADAELPVMAHVGMKPQSIRKLGGHGRIQRDFEAIRTDALAAQEAGAFSIVFELIPAGVAAELTAELTIPTIGIGAGPHCDGQVLVAHDMLGLTSPDFSPKFLKRYADLRGIASEAARAYVEEVQTGAFPDEAHSHQ